MSTKPKERRRFSRMPVSIMIRVKSEEDAENFVSNYTHNLSLGGMFLKSLAPKPIGTPVCIQLPFAEPPGYTEVHGRVASQNTTTDSGLLTGMGIEFTTIGNGAYGVLQRFIDGTWRDLFRVSQTPDEQAIIYAIDAFFGFLNFMLGFINRAE